jgi:hypothetical protein
MSITLDLKPETESHFEVLAAAQNIPVEDYIESVLESLADASKYRSLTPQQRSKELEHWLGSHGYISAPLLTDDAVSRESIYRDREDAQL